jgi:hypothetical protein
MKLVGWYITGGIFILFAVGVSFLHQHVQAQTTGTTYYVSTTGNDSNPGTIDKPFRNIITAMKRMNPGDTTLIRGGTYDRFVPVGYSLGTFGAGAGGGPRLCTPLDITPLAYDGSSIKSGTPTARMTLKAYPGEEVTWISDCRFNLDTWYGLVSMLKFEGRPESPAPSYWTIEGIKFLLTRSTPYDSQTYGVDVSARHNQINGMIFRNNTFSGNYREGILPSQQYSYLGGFGLKLDAWETPGGVKGTLIEGNKFIDYLGGDAMGVLLFSSTFRHSPASRPNEDTIIRNNYFSGFGGDGIHLDSVGHKNTLIEGNTFESFIQSHRLDPAQLSQQYGNSAFFFYEENAIDIKFSSGGLTTVRNNIMSGYRPKQGGGAAIVIHQGADNITMESNLFYDNASGIRIATAGPRYNCHDGNSIDSGGNQEMCWYSGETRVEHMKILRNIIVDNNEKNGHFSGAGYGVAISMDGVEDVEIAHNVIASNAGEGFAGSFITGSIHDNIFYKNGRGDIIDRTGARSNGNIVTDFRNFIIGSNLFFNPTGEKISYIRSTGEVIVNLSTFQSQTGQAGGSVSADPLFMNPTLVPTSWDYRVRVGSPAIRTGQSDFGAFEFGSTSGGGTTPSPTPTATPTQPPTTGQCSLYSLSSIIPAGFASPFNMVNNPSQNMMNASCSTSGQSINLGTGNQLTYIYKTGYVLRNNAWQQVNYTGSNLLYSNWYVGNATGALNLSQAELSQGTYFVSYQCQWTGSAWKCGCLTNACNTTANPKTGGMWQLQFIKQ